MPSGFIEPTAGTITGNYNTIPVTLKGTASDNLSGIFEVSLSETITNFNFVETYLPTPGCTPSIYNLCQPIPGIDQGPASVAFSLGPANATTIVTGPNNPSGFDQAVTAWDAAGNAGGWTGVGLELNHANGITGYSLTVCGAQGFSAIPGTQLIAAINDAVFAVEDDSVTTPGTLNLYIAPTPPLAFPIAGNEVFHALTNASFGAPATITIATNGLNLNGASPDSLRMIEINPDGTLSDITSNAIPASPYSPPRVQGLTSHLGSFVLVSSSDLPAPLAPPPGASGEGFSIASDNQGRLAEINVSSGQAPVISFYGNGDSPQGTVPIPNATTDGSWNIAISSGRVYAVGTVFGGLMTGTELEVLALDPVTQSSMTAVFVPPSAGKALPRAIAFDSSGNLWIAGLIQTGFIKEGTARASAALWEYQPQNNSLSLTASLSRAGEDGGFAVLPTSSAVWVAGYSASSSSSPLALALWSFDPQTGAPMGSPRFIPGFLNQWPQVSAGSPVQMSAPIGTGKILIAADKSETFGGTSLGLVTYDYSGTPHRASAWVPAQDSVQVFGVVASSSGLAVTGQINGNGSSQGALWNFDSSGNLLNAEGIATTLGAAVQGTALGNNIWLAVSDQAPPSLFANPTSLSGTYYLIAPSTYSSIFPDILPPRTTLSVGIPNYSSGTLTYVGAATPLGFLAVDDLEQVGDGDGSGVKETLFSVDASTFLPYVSSFTLTQEGIHTISYYSVDNAGNQEAVHVSSIAVDKTPPITMIVIAGSSSVVNGVIFASSGSLGGLSAQDPISNGVASGFKATFVSVNGGSFSQATSSGPPTNVLSTGTTVVSYYSVDNVGNQEGVKTSTIVVGALQDVLPPRTTLTTFEPQAPGGPSSSTFVTDRTSFTLSSMDDFSGTFDSKGLGVALQSLQIDSATPVVFRDSVPAPGKIFVSVFDLAGFSDGLHTLRYFAQDVSGNREAVHIATVAVDNTPPISSVLIGTPSVALAGGSVLLSAQTPLLIVSTDPMVNGVASGVGESLFSVNAGTFAVSNGSFTVSTGAFALAPPDGPETIQFYGVDLVGNTEVAKSTSVILDSRPPNAILLSPSPDENGLARVFNGKITVLGYVFDAHLQGYVLDFAPGVDAITGFTLIGSSPVAVSSGVLGIWDTTGLSGFMTLRLTASDLVDNITMTTATVFVGTPDELMVLKGRRGFNKPTGAAVDASGDIYVADTNNDAIKEFTSTGGFIAVFGREDGVQDDPDDRLGGRIFLNKPKDVKTDALNNIYIADTNNNRVVKLSPSGQVLLQLGRVDGGKRHKDHDDSGDLNEMTRPGKGLGQFNKPSGIALDNQGDIYVSDTKNHRVQIFGPDGSLINAFDLPTIVPPQNPETPGVDASGDPGNAAEGEPFGITVDSLNAIFVADGRGDRLLRFSPAGTLISSFGSSGKGVGQFRHPEGVAADPDGDILYVSDTGNNRVQRLNVFGNATLVFGSRGNLQRSGIQSEILFNQPVGLALDASGNLYVADRDNNAIEKIGISAQAAPVVVNVANVVQELIPAQGGGSLKRADRAEVDIPEGALSEDMEISIGPETNAPRRIGPSHLIAISSAVDYGPEGTIFNKPVTIVLPYNPQDLPHGTDPNGLIVHYWDPAASNWRAMPSAVATSSLTVSAQTLHFSLYQIMIPEAMVPRDVPSNAVTDAQIACNPLRSGCQPLRFRDLPAQARLRIYTLTGALVKNIDANSSGDASWDGTNQSGAPCASGVYFVFAQGAGTKKTFKVAIQR